MQPVPANPFERKSVATATDTKDYTSLVKGMAGPVHINLDQAVHQHYRQVYRFAYHLSRNAEDAADLTQHAYQKLVERHDEIKDTAKVRAWLQSIVYRKFVDRRRHVIRFPHVQFEDSDDTHGKQAGGIGGNLDAEAALEALSKLEEDLRVPLVLFYLESCSYKQIAATLDLPIGTVMSRLYRGKQRLYARLTGKES